MQLDLFSQSTSDRIKGIQASSSTEKTFVPAPFPTPKATEAPKGDKKFLETVFDEDGYPENFVARTCDCCGSPLCFTAFGDWECFENCSPEEAIPAWHLLIFDGERCIDGFSYPTRFEADCQARDAYKDYGGKLGKKRIVVEPCDGNPNCRSCWEMKQKKPAAPKIPARRNFDAHPYAFAAAARYYGLIDPALENYTMAIGSRAKLLDLTELARLANELLRGIRSDKPTMTPERWAEALALVVNRGKVAT